MCLIIVARPEHLELHLKSLLCFVPQVCDLCLSMGSKDNMTALVVKFPAEKPGTGGGVLARRQLRNEAFNKSNPSNNSDLGTYGNAVS